MQVWPWLVLEQGSGGVAGDSSLTTVLTDRSRPTAPPATCLSYKSSNAGPPRPNCEEEAILHAPLPPHHTTGKQPVGLVFLGQAPLFPVAPLCSPMALSEKRLWSGWAVTFFVLGNKGVSEGQYAKCAG